MNRTRRIITLAAIGAAVGAFVVGSIVAIISEARFVVEAVTILGIGGLVGGATVGALVGAVSCKKIIAVIGGAVGGILGCCLTLVITFVYSSIPWPSPQPYPDVKTTVETGVGSWGVSRSETYTTTIAMDVLQEYYGEKMEQYCRSDWQFAPSSDLRYDSCRRATCEIRRLWMEQYFAVEICNASTTHTTVFQVDSWQD